MTVKSEVLQFFMKKFQLIYSMNELSINNELWAMASHEFEGKNWKRKMGKRSFFIQSMEEEDLLTCNNNTIPSMFPFLTNMFKSRVPFFHAHKRTWEQTILPPNCALIDPLIYHLSVKQISHVHLCLNWQTGLPYLFQQSLQVSLEKAAVSWWHD